MAFNIWATLLLVVFIAVATSNVSAKEDFEVAEDEMEMVAEENPPHARASVPCAVKRVNVSFRNVRVTSNGKTETCNLTIYNYAKCSGSCSACGGACRSSGKTRTALPYRIDIGSCAYGSSRIRYYRFNIDSSCRCG